MPRYAERLSTLCLMLFAAPALRGQTTTNVNFDIVLTFSQDTAENLLIVAESGSVGSLGNASLAISAVGTIQNNSVTAPIQIAGGLYFNAIDSITFNFSSNDPNFFKNPVTSLSGGTITGGTGAYAGAAGSLNLTFGANTLIT